MENNVATIAPGYFSSDGESRICSLEHQSGGPSKDEGIVQSELVQASSS